MKSDSHIVHGGGWETYQIVVQPKACLFRFLSIFWLLISVCAMSPFLTGWPESFGFLEFTCSGLILLEPVFVTLAIFFKLTEKPRTVVARRPNPNYDFRKLY